MSGTRQKAGSRTQDTNPKNGDRETSEEGTDGRTGQSDMDGRTDRRGVEPFITIHPRKAKTPPEVEKRRKEEGPRSNKQKPSREKEAHNYSGP